MTLKQAAQAIEKHESAIEGLKNKIPELAYDQVIRTCSDITGVSSMAIIAKVRKEPVAHARVIVAHELRQMGLTFRAIGDLLNRNHSSIIHMEKTYHELYKYYAPFRVKAIACEKAIAVIDEPQKIMI